MSIAALLDRLNEYNAWLELHGDRVGVRALDANKPPADELLHELRARKAEVVAYLRWVEEADHALLLSTRRMAAAYPPGCTALDADPRWDGFESELRGAYDRQDRAALLDVILRRETHAMHVFAAWQRERTA